MSAGFKVTAPVAVVKTKAKDLRYLYRGAVAPLEAFDEESVAQVREAGLIVDVEVVTPAELEALEAEIAERAEADAEAQRKADADAAAAKVKADADAAAAAKAKADAAKTPAAPKS